MNAIRCIGGASLFALLTLTLTGCGGSGSSSSGGGGSSPQSTEILYAKDPDAGIFVFRIDTNSGNLTPVQTVTLPPSNNCYTVGETLLLVTASGRFLYTDDENCGAASSAYRLDAYSIGADGILTLVSGSPFGLPSIPIYSPPDIAAIAINPASTALYAIGYQFSGIVGFEIDASTGALAPMLNVLLTYPLGGSGAAIDPSGRFLYRTDEFDNSSTGTGISAFSIDPASGGLTPLQNSPYSVPGSSWPQQAIIDPTGHYLYSGLWSAHGVAGFVRNLNTGDLTAMPGSPFESESTVEAIAMNPSGSFLYAENYGDDTITAFAADPVTGVLGQEAGSPFPPEEDPYFNAVQGECMAVDPSGNFLYVGAGNSPGIAIYRINQSSGALSAARGSAYEIDGGNLDQVGGVPNLAVVQIK